jgi:hypothetical protein
MSERQDPPEPQRPDYFDRLLARYASVAPPEAAQPRTRVRPRLPGPFERIEALRTGPVEPDEPSPLVPPSVPRPAGPDIELGLEREIRTERHIVIRAEPAADAGRAVPPRPSASPRPLRSAAPAAPRHPPAASARPERADAGTGTRGAPRFVPGEPAGNQGVASGRDGTGAESPAAAFARPRAADTARARPNVPRAAAGRRTTRPAEPAVYVQIGRLEVRAASATAVDRTVTGRRREGRRAPTVSLADYLTGDSRRNGP